MTIKQIYDTWIGCFIDKPKRRIYIFPIPCLGIAVQLERNHKDYVGYEVPSGNYYDYRQ